MKKSTISILSMLLIFGSSSAFVNNSEVSSQDPDICGPCYPIESEESE